jgi:hypothetical protein
MRRWWAMRGRLFVLLQSLCLTAATLPPPTLHVVDGHFVLVQADGTALPPDALLGHEFSVAGQRLRITAIVPAPHHPAGPITLYDVRVLTPRSGPWEPYCLPDAHGRALAIPVTGTWTPDGRYVPLPPGQFTLTCTAGAHAKCLQQGYWPWATTPQGDSLEPYLQACTRLMRADYCGDGSAHTVPGRTVQVLERAGLLPRAPQAYGRFEAVWGVEGAVCLQRVRVPEQFPLETLLQECPRLRHRISAQCTEDLLFHHPAALLGNRS